MHLFTAHRILIASAVALAALFAAAMGLQAASTASAALAWLGVAGAVATAVLAGYLRWFWRKSSRLERRT